MIDEFLACDWGTTHLRIQCVDRQSGRIMAELQTADGAARLAGQSSGDARTALYCQTLSQRIAELEVQAGRPLTHHPIVISGMASSSIGWEELPYAGLPFRLDGSSAVWREIQPANGRAWPSSRRIFLISGARSECDVMRGEETQIVGLAELARLESDRVQLSDQAVVLLPGTHSKHIQLSGGSMVGFSTFMTGELYALLGTHSVLRHSVELARAPAPLSDVSLKAAFADGVQRATASGLSSGLFQVRTRQLLQGCPADENGAFLSGLLVGDELSHLLALAAAARPIILAAAGPLARAYALALEILGAGDRCTLLAAGDVGRLSALGQSRLLDRML